MSFLGLYVGRKVVRTLGPMREERMVEKSGRIQQHRKLLRTKEKNENSQQESPMED